MGIVVKAVVPIYVSYIVHYSQCESMKFKCFLISHCLNSIHDNGPFSHECMIVANYTAEVSLVSEHDSLTS